MFDKQEIAEKALKRAAAMRLQSSSRLKIIYSISAIAACLALIVGIAIVVPDTSSSINEAAHPSAAALFAGNSGGYVLIGVLGFVLGAAVTVLCMKLRKKED